MRLQRLLLGLLLALLLAGCEREAPLKRPRGRPPAKVEVVKIAAVLEAPQKYKGKVVYLQGKATPGLPWQFVDEQPYLLRDATGEIWVITTAAMPQQEQELLLRGRVVAPYQIKGRRWEVAVLELKRLKP